MNKAIMVLMLALLSACNGTQSDTGITSSVTSSTVSTIGNAPQATATPQATAVPQAASLPQATVSPSATPAPTATPSPTPAPTVVTYNTQTAHIGASICQEFANWSSATTTIDLIYSGYTYSFSGQGVSVTYSTGFYSGQTLSVLSPVTLGFGGNGITYQCTVSVQNGAVQSIVQNY